MSLTRVKDKYEIGWQIWTLYKLIKLLQRKLIDRTFGKWPTDGVGPTYIKHKDATKKRTQIINNKM